MRRSLAATVVLMRLTLVPLLAVLAATTPARTQHVDQDGFSLCSYTNSIGPCQPLTDQAMLRFGLSAGQTAIVATLRSLAANPSADVPPALVDASLAEPRRFAAVGAFSDYWFADVTNPGNLGLGVHLRYVMEDAGPRLFQMTYAVDGSEGHFTVLWNRAMVSPRR